MRRVKQFTWICGRARLRRGTLHAGQGSSLGFGLCCRGKFGWPVVDDWRKRLDSFPVATSPLFDATGASQNINQPDGDAFFWQVRPAR